MVRVNRMTRIRIRVRVRFNLQSVFFHICTTDPISMYVKFGTFLPFSKTVFIGYWVTGGETITIVCAEAMVGDKVYM